MRLSMWAVVLAVAAEVSRCSSPPSRHDSRFQCGTCSGLHAERCQSDDCTSRCVQDLKQCHSTSNIGEGCCCFPGLFGHGSHCEYTASNGTCHVSCCKEHTYGDLTTPPVMCGGGCCEPSTHGSPRKCGRRLVPNKRGAHAVCCIGDVSEEQQALEDCCIHDIGIDCVSPNKTSCCRPVSASVSSDKHQPCQPLTCEAFEPCPNNVYGADCRGWGSSMGKKTCCLTSGVVTNYDWCQRTTHDCESRYFECPGELGFDCTAKVAQRCCTSNGGSRCRKDCTIYRITNTVIVLVLIIAAAVLIWCGWRFDWLGRCSRAVFRRGDAQLLLPTGSLLLSPLTQHGVRVALIITCTRYQFYPSCPSAEIGGESLKSLLESMGYIVEHFKDTVEEMEKGFKWLAQQIAGKAEALGVVYFAGHSVEVSSKMMWVAIDSLPDESDGHFDVVQWCSLLQEVHQLAGMKAFDCAKVAKKAFFVVLADCCRSPPDGAYQVNLTSPPPGGHSKRNAGDRPAFYFLYACDPGRKASDGAATLSPFLDAVLRFIPQHQNLDAFTAQVAKRLAEGTNHAQRLWCREKCGEGSQCISLAPFAAINRGFSDASLSTRTPTSAATASSHSSR